MSNWCTFREAVIRAAEQAVCDNRIVVQWQNDARYSGIQKMLLQVVSAVPTYNREEEQTGTEEFSTMMTITVQFRCEDIEPIPALDMAEKTRINLRRRYVREPLRADGVVFVGMPGSVTPLEYVSDHRVIHTHVFETVFNFVFTTDTTELETITRVQATGVVRNANENVTVSVDVQKP